MRSFIITLGLMTAMGNLVSCASGISQVTGNEGGSAPVNKSEEKEYKRAILKCYKTGGTRVVKVEGELRCFD